MSSALEKVLEDLGKRTGLIAAIAIAAAGATAVGYLWHQRQEAREMASRNAVYHALKKPEAERAAELEKVVDQFPGTQGAFEAALKAGGLWMDSNAADGRERAKAAFERALSLATTPLDRASSALLLAGALESLKQWDPAFAMLEKAERQGEALIRGEILLAQARVREMQNRHEDAKAIRNRVIKELPGSEAAREAETQ